MEEKIKQLDSLDVFGILKDFPSQVEDSLATQPEKIHGEYDVVVVIGMGGSALGGALLADILQNSYDKPLFILRDYSLPGFVGSSTLVIAVSYSGETEETLSAMREAHEKGAQVLVITSGGQMMKIAYASNWQVLKIPPGLPPRMTWAFQALPILKMLSPNTLPSIEQKKLVDFLNTVSAALSNTTSNLALDLAQKLVGKQVIIYAASGAGSTAYKWKININENAKQLAFTNVFSELNHNEMLGFENPSTIIKNTSVVFIELTSDSARMKQRMEITKRLISSEVAEVITFKPLGTTRIEQLFYTIYFGDFVSFYLGILNGIDPGPVEKIEELKAELKKLPLV